MKESELLEILQTAHRANTESNVTGILLYADAAFIQVLEGDPQTVERLLRRIKRDPRHRRFLILLDRITQSRDFEGWPMAFERTSIQVLDQIAGYYDWTAAMPTRRKNGVAVRLIEAFRRAMVQS